MTTAFLTDKYELTMLQAALESGVAHQQGTFELFARKLPEGRGYGVVGGTERAIKAVRDFTFTEDQLAYLAKDPVFKPETIEYLRNYKFTGDISGYAEGDVYFPYSPILTVEGTFGDAVLLETVLLSIMNHDSAVASAASRMVQASEGRFPLIEMGSRRTHEMSAVDAARVAYMVGFSASSNLEAGIKYGVPTTGTSAHAFTLAHDEEVEAFEAQIKALGKSTTLLVDTYDIEQGIRNAVAVAGPELGGIRIDSGDLHDEPTKARKLLDSLGAHNTRIVVSSDIDEYSIEELVEKNTPIDGVGAGTRVVTGSGHPTAGMVFKLVEIEDKNGVMKPKAKKSASKNSVGGFKQVFRRLKFSMPEGRTSVTFEDSHLIKAEIVDEYYVTSHNFIEDENSVAVQETFMEKGEIVYLPTLEESRLHHQHVMTMLPPVMKGTNYTETLIEAHLLD